MITTSGKNVLIKQCTVASACQEKALDYHSVYTNISSTMPLSESKVLFKLDE